MMFTAGSPARQMFWGDILLTGCCVCYLLWWVLAFKPTGAIKGMGSGWLLIPAFLLGVAAVVMIIRGANETNGDVSFFSAKTVLLVGVIVYLVLFLVTWLALHRQVTTELLLIVGWAALVFWEINALYGEGIVTWSGAIGLFAVIAIAAALSIVCYILYYGLDSRAGYVDGMIPLVLAAGCMVVLAVLTARTGSGS